MGTTEQLQFIEVHVGEAYPDKVNPFIMWQTDGAWSQAEFCDAGAQEAAAWGGMNWPEELSCQWGTKGSSYVPFSERDARNCGAWHEPGEEPEVGWQATWDWNGNGEADHISAAVVRILGPRSWVFGDFNAGGGAVKYVWRDATYLHGWIDPTKLVHSTVTLPDPPPAAAPLPGNEPLDFDSFQPRLNWVAMKPYPRGATIGVTQAFVNFLDPDRTIDVDDVYGPDTRGRIIEFQRMSGLVTDGVVGRITATELHNLAVARGWNPFGA